MPKVFSIFDTNDVKVKENKAIKWNIYCTLFTITHWPYKKYLYRKSIEIETKEMMIYYQLISMMRLLTFYIAISMDLFFMFVYLHFFMIITMRSNTYYVYSVYKSSIFLLLFTDRLPPISTSFNTILKTNMKYVLQARSIRSTPARTHVS